jgi:hypothetical protein
MLEFVLKCKDCKQNSPFPTLDLGDRKPANPAGSPTDNWNVLFLCRRCAFVSVYADAEVETADVAQDPNKAQDHLYSLTFPCGNAGCDSQVTVYTIAAGPDKAEMEARTTAQRGDMLNQLVIWRFDSSVHCEQGHTPQKPTRGSVEIVLRGELGRTT